MRAPRITYSDTLGPKTEARAHEDKLLQLNAAMCVLSDSAQEHRSIKENNSVNEDRTRAPSAIG